MRNLKRALSLALASVMLLGMMVVGTSAASYPDVDSEDHVEAIDVLSAVGVIVGDNGNFRPDDNVSRNEMAVIMAKLILGTYEADSYVGSHPFTDVPDWASKYVAACYNSGIIAGRSETTYDGSATVTAVEAAAMMLRALGYEDLSKGYAQWDQPVAAKANEINLFDGLSGAGNAAMDRDAVAGLALNALQATMVTTERTGQDIVLPDGTTFYATRNYNERTVYTNDSWVSAIDPSAAPGNAGGYVQLGEHLYKGDLKLSKDGRDDFGRPASTWQYKKDDIIKVADEADKVYVGEVKAKDIYTDLNMRTNLAAGKVNVYEDSKDATNAKTINKNDADTKFGTDGQTVEVYYTKGDTSADDKADVVITTTYLGVVTDADYREDGKDGIRVDVFGVGLKFFETAGYKEDDVVLLNVSDNEIKAITGAPTTITGEATRVSTDTAKALTIDGKKYPQSVAFTSGDNDVVKGETNSSLAIEKTYTLYLDQNGCFLAAVEDEDNSSTDLAYVYRVYKGSTMDGDEVKEKLMATVVLMNGTYKNVAITRYDGATVASKIPGTWTDLDDAVTALETTPLTKIKGKLVDLIYDEDDKEYEIDPTPNSYTVKNGTPDSSGVELKTDTRYAELVNTMGNVYLNGSTVYVFVAPDGDDVDNVEVVTGGVAFEIGNSINVAYACDTGKTTAKYVVIADEFEAGADDVVYIKAGAKDKIKDGVTYEGWFANSTAKEKINVDKSSNYFIADSDPGNKDYDELPAGFYKYSEKTNGNLKLTKTDIFSNDTTTGATSGTIGSITKDDKGYLMTIGGVTFDLKDVNVIDMTDKDKSSENTYGSNVTSQSALERVVSQKTNGYIKYDVTVQVYANKDAEVLNLLISNIANKARTSSESMSADEIKNGLKGDETLSLGAGGQLSGNTEITEGTLKLEDAGNLNSKTLTVKGGTVEVTKNQTNGTVKLDGGTVKTSGDTTNLPKIDSDSKGTVEVSKPGGKVQVTKNDGDTSPYGTDTLAALAGTKDLGSGAPGSGKTTYTIALNDDDKKLAFKGPGYMESYSGADTLDTIIGWFGRGASTVSFKTIDLDGKVAKDKKVTIKFFAGDTDVTPASTTGVYGTTSGGTIVTQAFMDSADKQILLPVGSNVTRIVVEVAD